MRRKSCIFAAKYAENNSCINSKTLSLKASLSAQSQAVTAPGMTWQNSHLL